MPAKRIKKSPHPLASAFVRTYRNPLGLFGLLILGLILLAAIAAPLISPYDPIVQHQGKELLGPSATFWFGTDELGRDLLSRIIYGDAAVAGRGVDGGGHRRRPGHRGRAWRPATSAAGSRRC